jgi:tetratricopeptide (TPR) repeat protein
MADRTRLGRYEIGSCIGRGGAGSVYEAVMVGPGALRKRVALKILDGGSSALRREARLGGFLRHRHLVDVYEVGQADGTWFLSMELCQGGVLDHAPFPDRALADIGIAVCKALAYAFDALELVHLDIKPANLLLTADGTVKVADLGIARARGFAEDGRVRGTPGYMPPEQAEGRAVDVRADIYALGKTLSELAGAGHVPSAETMDFDLFAEPGAELSDTDGSQLAEALASILERCTSYMPEDRFSSMEALQRALESLRVEGPSLARHLGSSPPPSSPEPLGNLDASPDAFVGRERESTVLTDGLTKGGVQIVKGPPGIGKTRLAVEAACAFRDRTGRPAWFIDLMGVSDVDGLCRLLVMTLGLELRPSVRPDSLARALAARGAQVVVLDGFETLADSAAAIAGLVGIAKETRFVITSRVPVRLVDEPLELDVLAPEAARELLVARARARGLDLRGESVLDALIETLEGVPLVLELAAGRMGVLSPREVLERLDLQLLRDGSAGRNATLESAINGSWQLLGPTERSALSQLEVLEGSFDLKTVEAVVSLPGSASAVAAVHALVEQSLVRVVGSERLQLLQSIRAFVRTRRGAPEVALLRRRAQWFSRHGEEGAGARAAFHVDFELARDLPDCMAAFDDALQHGWWREAVEALAAIYFVSVRSRFDVDCVHRARQLYVRLDPAHPVLPYATQILGQSLIGAGAMAEAADILQKGLEATSQHDNHGAESAIRRLMAVVLDRLGDRDRALAQAREAVAIAVREGDSYRERSAQNTLGNLLVRLGLVDDSRAHYARAAELCTEHGHPQAGALVRGNIAILLSRQQRWEEAETCYAEAIEVLRSTGHRQGLAVHLKNLGIMLFHRGMLDRAAEALDEALEIIADLDAPQIDAKARHGLADVRARQGRTDEARALYMDARDRLRLLGDVEALAQIDDELSALDEPSRS